MRFFARLLLNYRFGSPIQRACENSNVVFSKDVPMFGTAASPAQYIVSNRRHSVVDESETQQMNSRTVYFDLVSWESEAVVECQPGLRCAARLYSARAE